MSQVRNAIIDHLQAGGVITKITAIAPPFSTTNLGDKCYVLRRQGWPIEKRWKQSPEGKRYAEYYLRQTSKEQS